MAYNIGRYIPDPVKRFWDRPLTKVTVLACSLAALPAAAAGVAASAAVAFLIREKTPVYLKDRQVNPFAISAERTGKLATRVSATAQGIVDRRAEFTRYAAPAPVARVAAPVHPPSPPHATAPGAPHKWSKETKQQVHNISRKLSCTATLWILCDGKYGCGLNYNTQTLLNLAAKATDQDTSLWKVFRECYPNLTTWQSLKAGFLYLLVHSTGILPKIIDTYTQAAANSVQMQVTGANASESINRLIEGVLKKAGTFFKAYNDAAREYADRDPKCSGLDLSACLAKAIRSLYIADPNAPIRSPEEEMAELCKQAGNVFIDDCLPAIEGNILNRFATRRLRSFIKNWILPGLLPTLLKAGTNYARPQENISFAITIQKFLTKQIHTLRESLNLPSTNAAPLSLVFNKKELATVFSHIQTTVSFSNTAETPEKMKAAWNRTGILDYDPTGLIKGSVLDYVEGQTIRGCNLVFIYLSNPQNMETLVKNLMGVTIGSFSANLVGLNTSVTDFNERTAAKLTGIVSLRDLFGPNDPVIGETRRVDGITFTVQSGDTLSFSIDHDAHVTMEKATEQALNEEALGFFKQVIPAGFHWIKKTMGLDHNPQALRETTQTALEKQQHTLSTITSALGPLLQEMRRKAASGDNIHPELIAIAEQISHLPSITALEAELDKLNSPPKKDSILRALIPIYEQLDQLTEQLQALQSSEELKTLLETQEKIRDIKRVLAAGKRHVNPWKALKEIEQTPAVVENLAQQQAHFATFRDKERHLKMLNELETLLKPWYSDDSSFFSALLYKKWANVEKIIKLLPDIIREDDTLAETIHALLESTTDSALTVNRSLVKQTLDTYRTLDKEMQDICAGHVRTWIQALPETLNLKLALLQFRIQRRKIEKVTAQIEDIQTTVTQLAATIPKIQTKMQVELSGMDVTVLGASTYFLWASPFFALAPSIGDASVATASNKALEQAEIQAIKEANKFFERIYALIKQPDIYRGFILMALKSFIDSKKVPFKS